MFKLSRHFQAQRRMEKGPTPALRSPDAAVYAVAAPLQRPKEDEASRCAPTMGRRLVLKSLDLGP